MNEKSTQPQLYPDPARNPAIQILDARSRLSDAADAEFADTGRRGAQGKQFLDVIVLRQILVWRDDKDMPATQIEKQLGLRDGVIARLGRQGIVGEAR